MTYARPLDDVPVHDPYVLVDPVADRYRLYTAFQAEAYAEAAGGIVVDGLEGTGVLAWSSTDLETWEDPVVVFSTPGDSWADATHAPWAPEVHAYAGRFYLFTTLHDPGTALPDAQQTSTLIRTSNASTGQPWALMARGSVTAVADSPLGPFTLLDPTAPITPTDFATLDGTLFVDDDAQPWMVYAHEWLQLIDGTIEAVPLTGDLARAAGDPIHLFRGSEASWLSTRTPGVQALAPYITDGPQLRRLPGGALLMLWSSYRISSPTDQNGEYVETFAVSPSGALQGPWHQGDVLVGGNAGHGMLFDGFDGRTRLIVHRGMNTPRVRAEIHAVELTPTGIRLSASR